MTKQVRLWKNKIIDSPFAMCAGKIFEGHQTLSNHIWVRLEFSTIIRFFKMLCIIFVLQPNSVAGSVSMYLKKIGLNIGNQRQMIYFLRYKSIRKVEAIFVQRMLLQKRGQNRIQSHWFRLRWRSKHWRRYLWCRYQWCLATVFFFSISFLLVIWRWFAHCRSLDEEETPYFNVIHCTSKYFIIL